VIADGCMIVTPAGNLQRTDTLRTQEFFFSPSGWGVATKSLSRFQEQPHSPNYPFGSSSFNPPLNVCGASIKNRTTKESIIQTIDAYVAKRSVENGELI
jgi:hypothetical protein